MATINDMTVKIKLMGVKKFIKRLKRAQRKLTPIQTYSPKRVRIEFDNINDVPAIWIDGKRIDDMHGASCQALQEFDLHWKTNTELTPERSWEAKYLVKDKTHFGAHAEVIGQRDGWHE